MTSDPIANEHARQADCQFIAFDPDERHRFQPVAVFGFSQFGLQLAPDLCPFRRELRLWFHFFLAPQCHRLGKALPTTVETRTIEVRSNHAPAAWASTQTAPTYPPVYRW